MPTAVSRRAITQGSLWAVPAIAATATAPAFAASGCPVSSCLTWRGTPGSSTFSAAVGSPSGSQVQLNFGIYGITAGCAPAAATGYRVDFVSVVGTDQSGVDYAGAITTQSNTPAAMNAPIAQFVGVRFADFIYNYPGTIDPDWEAQHHLASYKVCYTITYLDWLTRIPIMPACGSYCATITANPISTYITGSISQTLGNAV